jgi:hypothetical protein
MANEHHPVTVLEARPSMDVYIRAYCSGATFRTPATEGWQGRVRAWAARVELCRGSELQICKVDRGLAGKIHTSTVETGCGRHRFVCSCTPAR